MSERESPRGLFGLLAVGMGVCCGLPLLLSAGALGAFVGIGLGSWLVIAVGAATAAAGLLRWERQRDQCEIPVSDEVSSAGAGVDDRSI